MIRALVYTSSTQKLQLYILQYTEAIITTQ
jgi:hypothetical protein